MSQRRLRLIAGAVVLVPLLVFPIAVLAGGSPRFPTRDDCARAPRGNQEEQLEVVYGRFDDPVLANALLAELTHTGFIGAEVEFDPCGRWKVSYDAIQSLEQGEALAQQVRNAGFEARVESEA